MRYIVILFVVAAGLWYAFNGRGVAESDVYDLYNSYWNAFAEGDSKAVCDLFDDDFSAVIRTRAASGPVEETGNKSGACEATDKFYAQKRSLEQRAGTELFINTEYQIDEITIHADGKSATVRVNSEVRIGTEKRLFLRIREVQTDTVARSFGKTRFIARESEVSF